MVGALAGSAGIVKKETTGPHTKELVIQLHRRMGHASTKVMTDALKAGAWTNCGITTDEVTGVMSSYVCPICLLAKRNQTKESKHIPRRLKPKRRSPKRNHRRTITK